MERPSISSDTSVFRSKSVGSIAGRISLGGTAILFGIASSFIPIAVGFSVRASVLSGAFGLLAACACVALLYDILYAKNVGVEVTNEYLIVSGYSSVKTIRICEILRIVEGVDSILIELANCKVSVDDAAFRSLDDKRRFLILIQSLVNSAVNRTSSLVE